LPSRDQFSRLEMEAGKSADHLQMAELFGADIHQKVFPFSIFAIQALNGILHRGRQLSISAPNCSRSILPKRGSGSSTRIHKLFYMMIHDDTISQGNLCSSCHCGSGSYVAAPRTRPLRLPAGAPNEPISSLRVSQGDDRGKPPAPSKSSNAPRGSQTIPRGQVQEFLPPSGSWRPFHLEHIALKTAGIPVAFDCPYVNNLSPGCFASLAASLVRSACDQSLPRTPALRRRAATLSQ
jgi:hypothetical protein